jgi:hypothetical protein
VVLAAWAMEVREGATGVSTGFAVELVSGVDGARAAVGGEPAAPRVDTDDADLVAGLVASEASDSALAVAACDVD